MNIFERSSIEMLEQLAAMYVLGTEGIDSLDDENAVSRGIDELKTKLKKQTGEDTFYGLGNKWGNWTTIVNPDS